MPKKGPIYSLSSGIHICPECGSTLCSFDGKGQICPACAARLIKKLKKENRDLVVYTNELIEKTEKIRDVIDGVE